MKTSDACRLGYKRQKDYSQCLRYAIEENDSDSLFVAAYCYYLGDGTKKNYRKARLCLEQAINLGNREAMLLKAKMLEEGKGYERNYEQAFDLYKSLSNQNAYASYKVATYFRLGTIGPIDLQQFFYYISFAAEQGNLDAMNDLAYSYQYGIGVKQDINKSIEWNKRAIASGSLTALSNLSKNYIVSDEEKLIDEAKKNFIFLAKQGDIWSTINSKLKM